MGRARVRRERRRVARYVNAADPQIRPVYRGVSRRGMIVAIALQKNQLRALADIQDTRYFVGIDMGFEDQIAQVTVHQNPDGVIVIDDVQVFHHELETAGAPGLKALAAPMLKEMFDGQE